MKRKTPAAGVNSYQAYQASLKKVKKAFAPNPGFYKKQNAVRQQAVRVGGWANPATAETKFIDTSPNPTLTQAVSTWVSTPILLNGCIQGTEATQRLGRKITMTSLYAKINLTMSTTTTLGGYVRVAVVYDKQANGTAPGITDVFLNNLITSPNNLSNRDRFVKIVDMETPIISTSGDPICTLEIYRKLNLETCFNTGNAGSIGDITSGSLYLYVCNNASFQTAPALFTSQFRVKFTDP
jgi:Geminivirus coat protein/nuclear export factor BR1 family.